MAGVLCGFVIGGIGSRLAMFVLRLTSDPSLRGMETDDDFIIGRISSDTFFLLVIATALGVVVALFYLLVRQWLPERGRPAMMGVLTAIAGGAIIIKPEGIDFTLLDPLWLAIAMFVVLPGLYGVAMSAMTERLLRSAEERSRRLLVVLLPLLALTAAGPVGLIIFVLAVAGWVVSREIPLANLWRSPAVTWLGRAALAVLVVYSGADLVQDTVEIL